MGRSNKEKKKEKNKNLLNAGNKKKKKNASENTKSEKNGTEADTLIKERADWTSLIKNEHIKEDIKKETTEQNENVRDSDEHDKQNINVHELINDCSNIMRDGNATTNANVSNPDTPWRGRINEDTVASQLIETKEEKENVEKKKIGKKENLVEENKEGPVSGSGVGAGGTTIKERKKKGELYDEGEKEEGEVEGEVEGEEEQEEDHEMEEEWESTEERKVKSGEEHEKEKVGIEMTKEGEKNKEDMKLVTLENNERFIRKENDIPVGTEDIKKVGNGSTGKDNKTVANELKNKVINLNAENIVEQCKTKKNKKINKTGGAAVVSNKLNDGTASAEQLRTWFDTFSTPFVATEKNSENSKDSSKDNSKDNKQAKMECSKKQDGMVITKDDVDTIKEVIKNGEKKKTEETEETEEAEETKQTGESGQIGAKGFKREDMELTETGYDQKERLSSKEGHEEKTKIGENANALKENANGNKAGEKEEEQKSKRARDGKEQAKGEHSDKINDEKEKKKNTSEGENGKETKKEDVPERNIPLEELLYEKSERAKKLNRQKYGLLGILKVIKMSDPKLNMLALGTDLTTLGLNLNSGEYLFSNFGSPISDDPTYKEDYFVKPMSYLNTQFQLRLSLLLKLETETLFYIFYNLPKDVLQAYAASELYVRKWIYHIPYKIWFSPILETDSAGDTLTGGDNTSSLVNCSTWLYFDPISWSQKRYDKYLNTKDIMNVEEVTKCIEQIIKLQSYYNINANNNNNNSNSNNNHNVEGGTGGGGGGVRVSQNNTKPSNQ